MLFSGDKIWKTKSNEHILHVYEHFCSVRVCKLILLCKLVFLMKKFRFFFLAQYHQLSRTIFAFCIVISMSMIAKLINKRIICYDDRLSVRRQQQPNKEIYTMEEPNDKWCHGKARHHTNHCQLWQFHLIWFFVD